MSVVLLLILAAFSEFDVADAPAEFVVVVVVEWFEPLPLTTWVWLELDFAELFDFVDVELFDVCFDDESYYKNKKLIFR